jgi:hypothetical protein
MHANISAALISKALEVMLEPAYPEGGVERW